ncbi:unnamed protein product [Staurois parvus]|uniref:Uncharacterized protein n=1 Tax=Staurois parvus TaxID=386267 RepID=A0ABN9CQQ7_9NEOB|nr:unnamed protein product [Staurois parvus]
MISVAPAVPPVSQCPVSVPISAYQCTSMPNISAHLSCLSVSPISASQCQYQCQSVPPISAANQCLSVPPNSAHQ